MLNVQPLPHRARVFGGKLLGIRVGSFLQYMVAAGAAGPNDLSPPPARIYFQEAVQLGTRMLLRQQRLP